MNESSDAALAAKCTVNKLPCIGCRLIAVNAIRSQRKQHTTNARLPDMPVDNKHRLFAL